MDTIHVRMNAQLPPFVRATTSTIKELDEKVEDLKRLIRQKTYIYVKNLRNYTREEKFNFLNEIRTLYAEADGFAEKKVELAEQMYDKVDSFINEMDEYKKRLDKKRVVPDDKKLAKGTQPAKRAKVPKVERKKTTAAEHKAARLAENAAMMDQLKEAPVVGELEAPVNPHEPVYCVCRQVSFGQMVACDNKHCPTEWFHFGCVGIDATPSGVWYCSDCKQQPRRRK
ncbi:unnamed protein product [Caenorhabditis auriculariae]|uniref:Inhibitor of growth protein n=1 Tax=Caenorhabditis auriculariae TaxID=2777116 RepID=A0A8S1HPF9_9PELO|nr:unnamed protein product [Caenorhabditis auriculariae]